MPGPGPALRPSASSHPARSVPDSCSAELPQRRRRRLDDEAQVQRRERDGALGDAEEALTPLLLPEEVVLGRARDRARGEAGEVRGREQGLKGSGRGKRVRWNPLPSILKQRT